MTKVPKLSVARVWCGAMLRVGSKSHIYLCQDCKRAKRRYWKAANWWALEAQP